MHNWARRTLRGSRTPRGAVLGAVLVAGLSLGIAGAGITLGGCSTKSASGPTTSPSPAAAATAPFPSVGGVGHPGVVAIARKYLGLPYVRGAATPGAGFDAPGLVECCYGQIGIELPHSSRYQQNMGVAVTMRSLVPGGLVFKKSSGYQVAMYAGAGKVIVASRTADVVKYSTLAGWGHAVRLP